MPRPAKTIRRSLLNNILLIVFLGGAVILATTLIGAGQVAKSLSRVLIGQTVSRAEAEVTQFIKPVYQIFNLTQFWIRSEQLSAEGGAGDLLLPVLKEFNQLNAIMLIDPDGRYLIVSRIQDNYRLSVIDPAVDATTAQILYPLGETSEWQTIDYPIRLQERPWYAGAMKSEINQTYWTDAYTFFGGQTQGVTAAMRFLDQNGDEWVIATDLVLETISRFTTEFNMGYRGILIMTDSKGKLIGLPDLPQFATANGRARAYLKHPHELEFKLANDAAMAFQPDPNGSVSLEPVRFSSDAEDWWGQGVWLPLGERNEMWLGVLIPEKELLGSIDQLRVILLTAIILVTLLAVSRAIVMARRYARPISELEQQSLHISQGDFSEPIEIRSGLKEIDNLARAHKVMRGELRNLIRLEDDLQLAHQIQQKTFPDALPVMSDYDIAAASRPADATGGDTYDVIGMDCLADPPQTTLDDPDRVYLMLSDATGHGVGPALTASQVHAMFRMGVRTEQSVAEITYHMNHLLYAESYMGRFVTAWLARIDRKEDQIYSISSGQAPIIIYRAETDEFEHLSAEGPPLGVTENTVMPTVSLLRLGHGDILAVLSDGIFEARNESGEHFGQPRVETLIKRHAGDGANRILDAITDAVDLFLDGVDAGDDQTGIIVRKWTL